MEHNIEILSTETTRVLTHVNGRVENSHTNKSVVICSCGERLTSDIVNGMRTSAQLMIESHRAAAISAEKAAAAIAKHEAIESPGFMVVSFYQTAPNKGPNIYSWGPYTQARARKVRAHMLKNETPKEGSIFHVSVCKITDYTEGKDI